MGPDLDLKVSKRSGSYGVLPFWSTQELNVQHRLTQAFLGGVWIVKNKSGKDVHQWEACAVGWQDGFGSNKTNNLAYGGKEGLL